jgi:hypothetical protein
MESAKPIIKLEDFINSLRIEIQTASQAMKRIEFPGIQSGLPRYYRKIIDIDIELEKSDDVMIFIDGTIYYHLQLLNILRDSRGGEPIYQFSNYIFEDYTTLKDMVAQDLVFYRKTTHHFFTADESISFLEIPEKKEPDQKLSELINAPYKFPIASPILPQNYNVLRNVSEFINYKNSVIFIAVGDYYYPLTFLDSKGIVYQFSNNIITSFTTLKKLVDQGYIFVYTNNTNNTNNTNHGIASPKSPRRSPKAGSPKPKSPRRSPRAGAGAGSPRRSVANSGAGASNINRAASPRRTLQRDNRSSEYFRLSDLIKYPNMFPRSSSTLPSNYRVLTNADDFANYKNSIIFIAVGDYYYPVTLLNSTNSVHEFSDNIITSFTTFRNLVNQRSIFVPTSSRSPRR